APRQAALDAARAAAARGRGSRRRLRRDHPGARSGLEPGERGDQAPGVDALPRRRQRFDSRESRSRHMTDAPKATFLPNLVGGVSIWKLARDLNEEKFFDKSLL